MKPATHFLAALLVLAACGSDSNNNIDAGGDGDGDGDATPIDAAIDAPMSDCTPATGTDLAVELVTDQTFAPVLVTHAGDERLFVVEQSGGIRIIENGTLLPTPFLDLSSQGEGRVVFQGDERGLLGLTFHPQYQQNGRFFVHYSGSGAQTRIAEYGVSAANANIADTTEREIFTATQPFANHNGGMIEFGNDGMLYIGLGDGGSAYDPEANGQDANTPLGAILRLDVTTDISMPYTIPADNPFAAGGGLGEIWSTGWRNPWRFSFDPDTGDLWAGDVGQDCLEEISVQPATMGGLNFGWLNKEASECSPPNNQCNFPAACGDTSGMTDPYFEYSHNGAPASVTGGYLYRGGCIPDVDGWYIFADYEQQNVYALDTNLATPTRMTIPLTVGEVTSFGRDIFGELYIASVGNNGGIYKIVGTP